MKKHILRVRFIALLFVLGMASNAFGSKEKIAAVKSIVLGSQEGVYFTLSMDGNGSAFQVECTNPSTGAHATIPYDSGLINGAFMTSEKVVVSSRWKWVYYIFGIRESGRHIKKLRGVAITEDCALHSSLTETMNTKITVIPKR